MTDSEKPSWYDKMAIGPLTYTSAPQPEQIERIKQAVYAPRAHSKHKDRKWLVSSAMALVFLLLVAGVGFLAYEHKLQSDIRLAAVPKSAEWHDLQRAVMDFEQIDFMSLEHVHIVDDGVLVFYRRFIKENTTDLNVEYMRRTSSGWKRVYGGGFGAGFGQPDHQIIHYEYLMNPDTVLHTHTPFPIVYGTVLKPSVAKIVLRDNSGMNVEAVMFPVADHQTGWFAFVPDDGATLQIVGFDSKGQIIETQIFDYHAWKSGFSFSTGSAARSRP